jgi:hypothetical protein
MVEVITMRNYMIIAMLLLSVLVMGCAIQQQTGQIKGTPKTVVAEPEKIYAPVEKEIEYVEVEAPEPAVPEPATPAPAEPEPAPLPAEPELSGEEKAIEVVTEYVKNMGGYKDQMGRGLTFQIPVQSGCEGCWIVDLTFQRNLLYYPDKTEIIKMSVYLKNWKVDRYDFS